ncbi:TPA: lysis system i-spanin subunit Rz [Providencia alcalifaciens]
MASPLESTLTRSFKIALLIGACLLFTIGALTGAILARYHYNGIIQANQSQYQADLKAVSDEAHTTTQQAIARMAQAQREKQQLDEHYTKELNDAQNASQALRDELAAGRRRLQFARADLATCELTASHRSGTRTVGDGAEIRFSVEAGLLLEDIRAGIQLDQAKLDYLQAYVSDVVQECRREVTP